MASRLQELQARFQQKQMQEKEEKLLKLYENQQMRAFEKVGRGSAGSNGSVTSTGGGKVRQMFDERRQKAGIDRSYPLEPLGAKSNNKVRGGSVDRLRNSTTNSRTVVKSTVQKSVSQVRNGKPVVNRREVVQKIYNNNNGDATYEEKTFSDNNVDNPNLSKSHKDIVAMMNRHNLKDNLENEEMPDGAFDGTFVSGKLANLGGKLPSQNGIINKPITVRDGVGVNNHSPLVSKSPAPKKPVTKVVSSSPARTDPARTHSPVAKTVSSPPNTNRSKMSKQVKTPSNARPSMKQSNPRSPVVRDDLTECRYCGRRFATDRINVHEDVCSKTAKKKRKEYDALKHRVQGTELEPFIRKVGKKGTLVKKPPEPPKKDWRRTHEEFIATIRAAKMAQEHVAKGGKLTDLPPPPPSTNPDYVQCPHCGRRFNEAAADRHIPKCATYEFNKPKPGAKPGIKRR